MPQLTVRFNNKDVTIDAIIKNGVEFYNLNKIFAASSETKDSKRPNKWRNKLSKRYEEEGLLIKSRDDKNVPSKNLVNESLFGTQEVVVAYSQWIDTGFAYAVNGAFSALVDGDVGKVLSIAQQVASYHREEAR